MDRKSNNYRSDILYELTIQKHGFDPRLTGWQKKTICAICRYCGEPHDIYGANYRKNRSEFHPEGSACHKECRLKEQSEAGSPFTDEAVRNKAQLNRTKNISQDEINKRISEGRKAVQSQIEQTNLDRYGVSNPFQSDEVKEKIKQTNLEKYGVENPMQNTEIANKSKSNQSKTLKEFGNEIHKQRQTTNIERYGVENPNSLEKFKEKSKQTNLEKYGHENPMQNESIKNKSKSSILDKYGVEYPLQNPEILAKSVKKYSDTVNENSNGYYDNINLLRGNAFWQDMEAGFSINAICEKYNVDPASIRFHLVQDEFRNKYYSTYSFPKNQAQRTVSTHINSFGCEVLFNDRKTLNGIELDIYVPENKFAIEFNGSFWHSEAFLSREDAKTKHRRKTNECLKNGIRLFHLFEKTWDDRKEQVLSFLRSALGKNSTLLNARDCIISEDNGYDLVNDNHIQGCTQNAIKSFDLVHNGNVVGSIIAAKHHRQNGDKDALILSRLAFQKNVTVRGGASKLFSKLKSWAKDNGYSSIISWSDSAWTEGNIYKQLNFTLIDEWDYDYFYWDSKKNIYLSKQSQRKSYVDCPVGMTEREWATQRGLYRIWDCGKKTWKYNLT